MSATKIYTIWCDYADCPEWTAQVDSAGEARMQAKRNGWLVAQPGPPNQRTDYCPLHSFPIPTRKQVTVPSKQEVRGEE